jgi:hypothetical protein
MEISTEEDKKLEETIFSVLEPFLDLCHHVNQESYYNSIENTDKLLTKKTRICATIRANRMIPESLTDFSKN